MQIRNTSVAVTAMVVPLLVVMLGDRANSEDQTKQNRPPLVIKSLDGHDLYDFYCASCHGKAGKGDGPIAPKLKVRPPDLTALSARNGGSFPKERVEAILTGDSPMPTHGSKEMPVWGDVFRFLDPSDQRAKIRVANLVAYLQSLQVE